MAVRTVVDVDVGVLVRVEVEVEEVVVWETVVSEDAVVCVDVGVLLGVVVMVDVAEDVSPLPLSLPEPEYSEPVVAVVKVLAVESVVEVGETVLLVVGEDEVVCVDVGVLVAVDVGLKGVVVEVEEGVVCVTVLLVVSKDEVVCVDVGVLEVLLAQRSTSVVTTQETRVSSCINAAMLPSAPPTSTSTVSF